MNEHQEQEDGRIIGFMLDDSKELSGVYQPVYRLGERLRRGYASAYFTRDWFSKGVRQGRIAALKEPCRIADCAMVFALSIPDLQDLEYVPNVHEIHGHEIRVAVLKLGAQAHHTFFGAWQRFPESKAEALRYVCAALIMDHYLFGNPRIVELAKIVKKKLRTLSSYEEMKMLVDLYAKRFKLPPPVLE